MELKELCRAVSEDVRRDPDNWASLYCSRDGLVREAVSAHDGVKTDFYADFGTEETDRIRVAVVLSDFTSVFLNPRINQQLLLMAKATPVWPAYIRGSAQLFNPGSAFENVEINEGIPAIRPAFRFSADAGVTDFMQQFAPLAEAGRLMFRPMPVMLGRTNIRTDKGGMEWRMCEVDPNVPGDTWIVREHRSQLSQPMTQDDSQPDREARLATIMLPYLTGVSYADLARILDDEEHCIGELRSSVKALVKEVDADPSLVLDVLNDKVRPATDKVERKFRQISQVHSLRIGGAAVCTIGAALTAFFGPGVLAAAGVIVGATGAGAIVKESADLLKARSDLRDMPFYLLWRLQRAKQS